ncbi:MAG: hypothetical protein JEZ10_03030 [Verrucomicrobia bacterium]|nr:hypothetical protein [Verrucomicrobiota bacterium]
MIIHKKFKITPSDGDCLREVLLGFPDVNEKYIYAKENSEGCTSDVGTPYVNYYSVGKNELFCLMQQESKTWELINIVPLEKNELTIQEYNHLVDDFTRDIRKFLKQQKLGVKTSLSRENKTLEEIIPDKHTRKALSWYINGTSLSGQYDIEVLEKFICLLHRATQRYRKRNVYVEEIVRYLDEDTSVPKDVVLEFREKVESGLSLLNMNMRRF